MQTVLQWNQETGLILLELLTKLVGPSPFEDTTVSVFNNKLFKRKKKLRK